MPRPGQAGRGVLYRAPGNGAPPTSNGDIHHRIVALIRNGNYVAVAARASGISPTAYYTWVERGEADLEQGKATPFAVFAEACARAKAEAEATLLARIQMAAGAERGDWKAAAWMLERMYPDRYGPRQQHRHRGAGARKGRARVVMPSELRAFAMSTRAGLSR